MVKPSSVGKMFRNFEELARLMWRYRVCIIVVAISTLALYAIAFGYGMWIISSVIGHKFAISAWWPMATLVFLTIRKPRMPYLTAPPVVVAIPILITILVEQEQLISLGFNIISLMLCAFFFSVLITTAAVRKLKNH